MSERDDVQGLHLPPRFAPRSDREWFAVVRAALAEIVVTARGCDEGEGVSPAWLERVGRAALEEAEWPGRRDGGTR